MEAADLVELSNNKDNSVNHKKRTDGAGRRQKIKRIAGPGDKNERQLHT